MTSEEITEGTGGDWGGLVGTKPIIGNEESEGGCKSEGKGESESETETEIER